MQIEKGFTVTTRAGTTITLTPIDSSTGAGADHPGSVTITSAVITCCDREGVLLPGQRVVMRLDVST